LLRAPFRVSFSYSSGDGSWSDTWQNASDLPSVVRFLVRDSTTGRTLAISSATMVHVELPADCAGEGAQTCSSQPSLAASGAAKPTDGPDTPTNGPDTATNSLDVPTNNSSQGRDAARGFAR
jgi:hypothetical protein